MVNSLNGDIAFYESWSGFSFSACIEVRVCPLRSDGESELCGGVGSNTLFLGSSGDGFYGHYRAEGHFRPGSYIDPWRERGQPKKLSKARPALLS